VNLLRTSFVIRANDHPFELKQRSLSREAVVKIADRTRNSNSVGEIVFPIVEDRYIS
jgi:hypothetical protein